MAPNLDCELDVPWLPTSVSRGFPTCGPSMGTGIVVQQDALWQSPSSFRADCRLQPSLKHVTIGCTCDSCSACQVGLKNRPFFILRGCGCGWMARALCISHTLMALLKHFNPPIHNSTRESIVPILSTLALMNLSTWYTFCPQKPITDRCSSLVQFSSFAAMFTAS
jgi:hypothetical protein